MYCSNYYHNFVWNCEAEFKEHTFTELHTGVVEEVKLINN
jgi:hypothetical protein